MTHVVESRSSYTKSTITGKDQFAQTPSDLMDVLTELFYPPNVRVFDPCPVDPQEDGLAIEWKSWNFVNPPFREASKWIRKAWKEEEGKATVVLVPVRTSTTWMHNVALPSAESIIIWINAVTFKPHVRPLPLAIMTFGIRCSPVKATELPPHIRLFPVNIEQWSFPGIALPLESLAKRIQEKYQLHCVPDMQPRVWSQGMESTWNPGGVTVVSALGSPRSLIRTATSYTLQHPGATLVMMMLPLFNGAYFRTAAATITEIVFLKPRLSMDIHSRASMQGSVLVVMKGQVKKDECTGSRGVCTAFLGLWRGGVAFGSKTAVNIIAAENKNVDL